MKPLFYTPKGPLHLLVRAAQIGIISGGLLILAGCDSEPESHRVSAPPPGAATASQPVTVVTPSGAAAPAVASSHGSTIIVTQAPPAPQTENPGPQPSSEDVWVPGYWTWHDDQYEWVAGHWTIPPEGDKTWIPPHWEQEGSSYRFYEGYWQ